MSRKPRVTRTIEVAKITILFADSDAMALVEDVVEMTRVPKDNGTILKIVRSNSLLNKGRTPVEVRKIVFETRTYSMPEEEFISHADCEIKEDVYNG